MIFAGVYLTLEADLKTFDNKRLASSRIQILV